MKQTLTVVTALLAGFVGGILGSLLTRGSGQHPPPAQVIRARSFELVDQSGRAISYWGMDNRNYAVLAFGSCWRVDPRSGAGELRPAHLRLDDPRNQRAALGVVDDYPFLEMNASNGEPRMKLNLSIYEKPMLWMGDETGRRLSLGVEHTDTPGPQDNNWALDFAPDRARIGMFTVKEDGRTYVRGLLSVVRDKVKYP